MARISYVHVMGGIALLPCRDYLAMTIEIASMARILYVHVIGRITLSQRYLACFVGVSSSSVFCIIIIQFIITYIFLVFQTSGYKTVLVRFMECTVTLLQVATPCLSIIFSFAFIYFPMKTNRNLRSQS